ncbi:MAG: PilT/PilU family type 4a pilus ATPase [bacterium]|nr:PilT/PilU family type 4a pilus ATPase [bacterium]
MGKTKGKEVKSSEKQEDTIDIRELLKIMVDRGASDIHLKVGSPPVLRVDGRLQYIDSDNWRDRRLSPKETEMIAKGIITNPEQMEKFKKTNEADLAYSVSGIGRFRVCVFCQRGSIGIVLRFVPFEIPEFETLNLPDVVLRLAEEPRGLILVTGQAGSGKSTTLAAMIEHINRTRSSHIVTIEDPIEFLHKDKKSIIDQREVGLDTLSFHGALRHILRQDPDVILIGEMRDLETITAALSAAETGHLVLSTLHTIDASQTIERIINFYPPHQHNQIRMQLSLILKGIISMRLLPAATGGQVPAVEVLVATGLVKKLIFEGRTAEITDAIVKGKFYGMQTFNQSLISLYQNGKITYDEALSAASNPEELKLHLSGIFAGEESSAF